MLPLFNGTRANQQRARHANQPAKLNFANVITGSMHFPATWYHVGAVENILNRYAHYLVLQF
jgi:hypothetical protein